MAEADPPSSTWMSEGNHGDMEVRQLQQPTASDLANAYLRQDASVIDLYDYAADRKHFASERAADLDRWADASVRAGVVAALRKYNQEVVGLTPELEELLQKLSGDRCLVVATGQQAGLFTGPLYSVYKAVSAVAHAAYMENLLGRPVVPVFWVATEDHDFEEVASAWYVTYDGRLTRSRLHYRPAVRTPVGLHAIAPEEFHRLIGELSVHLPEGGGKQDLLYDLDDAYHQTRNMGDFFARLLGRWMRDTPILMMNPMRPDLRALARPAFTKALLRADEFHRAAVAGRDAVMRAGFAPQADVHPGHSLLYVIEDGKRHALDIELGGGFSLRDSKKKYSRRELEARLQEHPEQFSAGVLYRPIVQDHLLPVLSYVGGAAEIAYHGMLGEVFKTAERKVPPLLLRRRAVVVPRQVQRIAQRYEVSLEESMSRDLLEDYPNRMQDPPLESVIADLKTEWGRALRQRASRFTDVDPVLAAALARTEHALDLTAERLRARVARTWRRNNEDFVQSLQTVSAWMRPGGHEQERTLSPLSVMAKYGHGWIRELASLDANAWDDIEILRM